MKRRTWIWAEAMVLGWALLIGGLAAGSHLTIGCAAFVFVICSVERCDNLLRGRRR